MSVGNSLFDFSADSVQIQQADPNNPLHSEVDFVDIINQDTVAIPENADFLLDNMSIEHFDHPSRIQGIAIPGIIKKPYYSIFVQAQNGTGKTLTFVLGLLCRIRQTEPHLQSIILTTNFQLAKDVEILLRKLSNGFLGSKDILLIEKGMQSVPPGKENPKIIIADGTFTNVYKDFVCSFDFSYINQLIIDEIDDFLIKFSHELDEFLKKLNMNGLQIVVVSATTTPKLEEFLSKYLPKRNTIKCGEQLYLPTNDHYSVMINTKNQVNFPNQNFNNKEEFNQSVYLVKLGLLRDFFMKISGGINSFIFVNKSDRLGEMEDFFNGLGFSTATSKPKFEDANHRIKIQSNEQLIRTVQRSIEQFRKGEIKIFICTNEFARGLDVPAAKIVINMDLPVRKEGNEFKFDLETYTHRQGRSGRFGAHGKVINFVVYKSDRIGIKELEKELQKSQIQLHKVSEEEFISMIN